MLAKFLILVFLHLAVFADFVDLGNCKCLGIKNGDGEGEGDSCDNPKNSVEEGARFCYVKAADCKGKVITHAQKSEAEALAGREDIHYSWDICHVLKANEIHTLKENLEAQQNAVVEKAAVVGGLENDLDEAIASFDQAIASVEEKENKIKGLEKEVEKEKQGVDKLLEINAETLDKCNAIVEEIRNEE